MATVFRHIGAAALCSIAMAAPALAQDDSTPTSANRVTIGVGAISIPRYIGSSQNMIVPTAAVQGQIDGISFNTLGTTLYVDAVPDHGGPGWKLQAGPMLGLRLDRHSMIEKTPIAGLGRLKRAWEPGAWIGIQRTGVVTSPYDTLSLSASYQHDVSSAHDSYVISPSIDYTTPLSHKMLVSLSLSADYVGRGFGRYYYDIDPAGSSASGLPAYDGADRAGWKDANISMTVAHSLTGNLLHGFALFASGGYARMLGPYRRSPIVSVAGSPDQWTGAIGLAYTF